MTATRLTVRSKPPRKRDPRPLRRLGQSALAWRTAIIVALLVLWEILSLTGVLDKRFFARPSIIVRVAIGQSTSEEVYKAIIVTLEAVGGAVAIGSAAALVVGVMMGMRPLLREAYYPIIMLLLGTPKSVLLPVFVMLLGLGLRMSIAYGALLAFIQVTINVVAGMDLIDPKHLTVTRAFNASPFQRFVHVIVPSAGPGIFAGLWSGLQAGFIGVLISQLFGSSQGIGYLVETYSNNFQTAEAMAVTIFISLVVILAGTGWNRLQNRLTRWRPNPDGTGA